MKVVCNFVDALNNQENIWRIFISSQQKFRNSNERLSLNLWYLKLSSLVNELNERGEISMYGRLRLKIVNLSNRTRIKISYWLSKASWITIACLSTLVDRSSIYMSWLSIASRSWDALVLTTIAMTWCTLANYDANKFRRVVVLDKEKHNS